MGQFKNNENQQRFEYVVKDQTVYADYRLEDGVLYIDYVEAPVALRGSGAAGEIMAHILAWAQKQNLDIVPICGYASAWMARHGD